jgi:3-hydroxyisobutyrate dehydrogenase-like beta-hydroxyacid dehydrogenase
VERGHVRKGGVSVSEVAESSETSAGQAVGIIGLGIMGLAYARNLLKAGFAVSGFDISAEAADALGAAGGRAVSSPEAVARDSSVILLVLASVPALESVASALAGMAGALRPGTIVVEMGTLPLAAKEKLRDTLEPLGARVLDCPVSGTGAQAAVGDLVVYASGDEAAVEEVRPVFDGLARSTMFVGPFGAGMKLKYVANLLVTIHNLATAEALALASQSGLDLQLVFEAIRSGAGNSRMFEVRAPLMIAGEYEPATMKMDVYMKDLTLIQDHARAVRCPTPLMAASVPYYVAALAEGRDKQDTAALYAVLQGMMARKEKAE